jgi:hypothetical protein
MVEIAQNSKTNPQEVLSAPRNLFRKKCDDVLAAKTPILSFQALKN